MSTKNSLSRSGIGPSLRAGGLIPHGPIGRCRRLFPAFLSPVPGVWGLEFKVWSPVIGIRGLGFKVWSLVFGVWGLGLRVEGLVFGNKGLGVRV